MINVEDYKDDIAEFKHMSEFLSDENFDYMMNIVEKIIRKPDVPAEAVEELIIQLQALSGKMSIKALYYRTLGKDGVNERTRKDAYYSAREVLDRLVDALKYVSKDKQNRLNRNM